MSSSPEVGPREGEWVPYRERPEWSDVTPLPQLEAPNPVVQIAYTDRFKDVYDYFRAILKSGEKSLRALSLTEDALELNPANYTVWHYRRELLKATKADLKEELQYCREVIEEHPKNYQVWQHRRVLVEWLNEPGTELRFTEVILAGDQKNYHAWQHRQWVIQTFSLFDGELEFVERLLLDDIRNNSAWNQRFFVVTRDQGWTNDNVEREVRFAIQKINIVKRNESAWNYLRGVLEHSSDPAVTLSQRALVESECRSLMDSGCDSPYLIGFLVELLQFNLEKEENPDKVQEMVKEAVELCVRLAQDIDSIRARYWAFISDTIVNKYGNSE